MFITFFFFFEVFGIRFQLGSAARIFPFKFLILAQPWNGSSLSVALVSGPK